MSDIPVADRSYSGLSPADTNEINLLEYLYILVKYKWLILSITILGSIGGYVAAKIKGPTWVAEAVIAPKDAELQKTPNLSGLGAFGGLVASQLSIGGNASLDKIDQLISSRDFNARLADKYSILPELYRHQQPKLYALNWDSSANDWKKTFRKPEPLEIGSFLKSTLLKKSIENNLMTITINTRDSAFSLNLAHHYVEFLNDDIKSTVRKDAKENVSFLEKQLITVADPLLREKLQTLIAEEIEKTMVVSKEAFRVVDPVYLQKRHKERRLYPLAFGGGLFFMTLLLVIFGHALGSAQKTEEDRILIAKIRNELLPGKKH